MEIGVPQSWRNERERYLLIGSQCSSCSESFFPARQICPKCMRKGSKGEMSEKRFTGNGTVLSYSVVYVPPTGYKLRVPYTLALIQLDEGPTVLGIIDDVKPEEVKVGARVEQVFRKWAEGRSSSIIHYGFAFRLV